MRRILIVGLLLLSASCYADTYTVPTLDEFYIPIPTQSSVIGALFGSLARQNKEIQEYWNTRAIQLSVENKKCTDLEGDENIKKCLDDVRDTEVRKSTALINLIQQRSAANLMQSMYAQSLVQRNQQMNRTPINCMKTAIGFTCQ